MRKKKTKKLNKKQIKQRQQLYKNTIISTLLVILVLGISYVIFSTDLLQPRVNEVTASYISFNNNDTTDIIKINNIKRMSNDIGKSIVNNKSRKVLISGEENNVYQIVIYPLINNIDLKYINFSITIGNESYEGNLATNEVTSDEGIVAYTGKVSGKKEATVKMWVSKEYEGEIDNNSFKIKINPRQES